MKPRQRPEVKRQTRAKAPAQAKHGGRKQDKARKKETLVFDPNDRIDFVKGFQKRKQERRERAKQEAAEQEREIRKLLRQKRREALKRAQLGAGAGHENEADEDEDENEDGSETEADESGARMKRAGALGDIGGGGGGGGDGVRLPPSLNSGDIE